MLASPSWAEALRRTLKGDRTVVRGKGTVETIGSALSINMRYPIVLIPDRKLSYRFMAGEAHWILSGSNRLADMELATRRNWSAFSDDGETLFGAYGPKIKSQLDYVYHSLNRDKHSRQAVINIWRENPPETKDYPCTLSMQFLLRGEPEALRLNTVVSMRSWDLWWGAPYDMFVFTMVSVLLALRLRLTFPSIQLGILQVTAGSMHIYEQHWDAARYIVKDWLGMRAYEVHGEYDPMSLSIFNSPEDLMHSLNAIKDTSEGALKLIQR